MASTLTPAEVQALIARMGLTFVGPVLIGTVFNSLFTGVTAMQYLRYFSSGYKDSKYTRMLVVWCAIVDAFNFGACLSFLWQYAVEHYGDPKLVYTSHFAYAGNAVMSIAVSVPIQIFLAYRIKLLSGQQRLGNILFVIVTIPALVEGAFGITLSTCLINRKLTVHYRPCIKWSTACIASAILCDLMLTGLLFYYLSRSKSTFRRTNSLVTRILVRSIESCAFLTAFCACGLLFYVFPGTAVSMAFNIPVGRIYCITLMTSLNSRPAHGEDRDTSGRSLSASGVGRNGVQISVQREVQQEFPLDRFQKNAVVSMNESNGELDLKRGGDLN